MSSSVPRVVEQALLGEDADLEVDGPLVLVDEGLDAVEAPQPHHRVHLQVGPHVGGALQDALLHRPHRPLAYLVGFEVLLGLGDLGDGLLQRSLDGLATVEQAGLVEVNVGLDEPRRNQASLDVDLLSLGGEPGLDGGDAPVLDADVDRRLAPPGRRSVRF